MLWGCLLVSYRPLARERRKTQGRLQEDRKRLRLGRATAATGTAPRRREAATAAPRAVWQKASCIWNAARIVRHIAPGPGRYQLPNNVDVARLPAAAARAPAARAAARRPARASSGRRGASPRRARAPWTRRAARATLRQNTSCARFSSRRPSAPQNALGRRERAGEDARVLGPVVQMAGRVATAGERRRRGAFARFRRLVETTSATRRPTAAARSACRCPGSASGSLPSPPRRPYALFGFDGGGCLARSDVGGSSRHATKSLSKREMDRAATKSRTSTYFAVPARRECPKRAQLASIT